MAARHQLRRLEAAMRGKLESFELEDGSRHYYDNSSAERFVHSMACLGSSLPRRRAAQTKDPGPPPKLSAQHEKGRSPYANELERQAVEQPAEQRAIESPETE